MRSGIPGDQDPSLLIRADHGRPSPAGGSPGAHRVKDTRASTSSNRSTQPSSRNQSAGTHAGRTIRAVRQFTRAQSHTPAATPRKERTPPALATSARRTRLTAADLTFQRLNNGTQIGPLCATMITEEFALEAAQNGGSARGYLPTHSRSWPLWPPLGYGPTQAGRPYFYAVAPAG